MEILVAGWDSGGGVEAVGHLHRQRAARGQHPRQSGQQAGVVPDPVQGGVAEEEIEFASDQEMEEMKKRRAWLKDQIYHAIRHPSIALAAAIMQAQQQPMNPAFGEVLLQGLDELFAGHGFITLRTRVSLR